MNEAKIRVFHTIIEDITNTLGSTNCESGGLLGSSSESIIDAFYFDKGIKSSRNEYYPNIDLMQNQIRKWESAHISFKGIIHSHTSYVGLSEKDVFMSRRLLRLNSFDSILMPLYILEGHKLIWYEVSKSDIIVKDCDIL